MEPGSCRQILQSQPRTENRELTSGFPDPVRTRGGRNCRQLFCVWLTAM